MSQGRSARSPPEQPSIHMLTVILSKPYSRAEFYFHNDVDGLMMTELIYDWRGIPQHITKLPIDTAIEQLQKIRIKP